MTKEEVEKIVRNNSKIKSFIENDLGLLEFNICSCPIFIIKEEEGVSYAYKLPYSAEFDYSLIKDFMQYAIPEVNRMIEKKRANELFLAQRKEGH